MLGSTGSVVWCVCFVLVISFCMVLCTGTWVLGIVSAVLVAGVLYAHHFVEVCSNVSKACGSEFVGTGRIPLLLPGFCQVLSVLACWLLQKRLGTLYYRCVGVRHMIQDCVQTVLHRPRCALLICLGGLVILGLVFVEPCGLVGCCSQPQCPLHSWFARLGLP